MELNTKKKCRIVSTSKNPTEYLVREIKIFKNDISFSICKLQQEQITIETTTNKDIDNKSLCETTKVAFFKMTFFNTLLNFTKH